MLKVFVLNSETLPPSLEAGKEEPSILLATSLPFPLRNNQRHDFPPVSISKVPLSQQHELWKQRSHMQLQLQACRCLCSYQMTRAQLQDVIRPSFLDMFWLESWGGNFLLCASLLGGVPQRSPFVPYHSLGEKKGERKISWVGWNVIPKVR